MKIICEKEKLIKGINSVIRGVPTRTTLPILEGILIQTNKNEIKLTTYDLELGIEYILEANVEEEGSIVVNSIMFSEIIRKLPNSDIKITVNNQNLLIIECEGSVYKLSTMNPEEFPELPKINIEKSLKTEQKTLKEMIRKTIFAVSQEENRPIFTGCLFEVVDNTPIWLLLSFILLHKKNISSLESPPHFFLFGFVIFTLFFFFFLPIIVDLFISLQIYVKNMKNTSILKKNGGITPPF